MPEPSISFSVIVPTYNRLPLLRKTLESLFAQDFADYEIIVVNDGSTDGTAEYLEELQAAGKLRCYHQQHQGPARGRNVGLYHASKNYIALIDDDCIAPPNWLSLYNDVLLETSFDVVGGSSRTGDPGNPCALTNDHIANFFKLENLGKASKTPFLTSNNTVYRASSLNGVGGFDPMFTIGAEERDLNYRLIAAGAKVMFTPAITIEHWNDSDLYHFFRHQVDQGRGSYIFYRHVKERYHTSPSDIGRGSYGRLLLSPFRSYSALMATAVFFLIILAQVGVTIGYIYGSVRYGKFGVEGSA